MAQQGAEETEITSEKRYVSCPVQVAQNLLLVFPFWPADLKSDLPKVNPPAAKSFRFVLGNVVVENDHAAVLGTISFTNPRRVSDNASWTASGVTMPRYC